MTQDSDSSVLNQEESLVDMNSVLQIQKQAFLAEGSVSMPSRVNRIERVIEMLVDYRPEICDAISSDFGHRSHHLSLMADIAGSIEALKHNKKHLRRWMRPERRKPMFPLGLMGTKAWVQFQPKGVVGLISPWNFPVSLTFCPLADVLAAGNRCMIKPSEFTPMTSALMKKMISERFDPSEIAVFTGAAEVAAAFSGLAFDHLIFTGSTSVGRQVMHKAADNLVPLTLELGGKSPVIVSRRSSIQLTADRIMFGKLANAGQICIAPDYLLVPEDKRDPLLRALQVAVTSMYPDLKDNADYTSIINTRHFERLQGYIQDARDKGAEVIELNPAGEAFSDQLHLKIPPTLIINPTDEMKVMQDEIFGPILPIVTYEDVQEAIDYVNARPRPLALYYFGNSRSEEKVITHTTVSGNTVINDVIMHYNQNDLPFGGIGPSGMGCYRGHDGFMTFSHKKGILKQTKRDIYRMAGMFPPYGKKIEKLINSQVKK